jgi:hypothetical protein
MQACEERDREMHEADALYDELQQHQGIMEVRQLCPMAMPWLS